MTQVYDDIIVDEEFAALIPPATAEERQQLEANLVEHGGARDPIVVWAKAGTLTIVDGHTRYEICARLGLPFDYHEIRFKDREEAADWIDRNQLGRRNLTQQQASLLRGRRYNRTKKDHGGDRRSSGQNVHLKTAESLAAEHGVDEKTIRRDGEFAEAVKTLGLEPAVASGEVAVPKAAVVAEAKKLPEKPKAEEVAAARQRLEARKPAPRGKFRDFAPTVMLEAIEHYSVEFWNSCPSRAGELTQLLEKLLGEFSRKERE